MTVKCLVWDLDETLWDGVLEEDRDVTVKPDALKLIKRLDERGILQSVASRNDARPAMTKLEQLGLTDYFLHPQFGFGTKSGSIRTIADLLRFDLGTMAFVDDNAVERAEVTWTLPPVRCYRHDQVAELADLPEFTPPAITEESARRRTAYLEASRREASRSDFTGTDIEFVRGLDVLMRITEARPADLARVSELTARTTQMNATGTAYSEDDLRAMAETGSTALLVAEVTDRFGTYGKAGFLVLDRAPGLWRLRMMATSCRVVPLGAGAALLGWLSDSARAAGAHIVGDFRRTERNRLMEIAYRFAGFTDDLPTLDCTCLERLPGDTGDAVFHLVPRLSETASGIAIEGPLL
ncbi:HAD family hydrolase [Amycolatopsis sp. WAC 04197]|uniref:HAD-IIIC family phosphatase n=1 Tax=Amycolatopsis sp. WAC 04197 TaxID=2203199 RepID=UPI001315A306|nr:HAD-IIIC family phosphatase [Amycolatopsis sp. WAC 04197]